MTIPPEIRPLIFLVRRFDPRLDSIPDEQLAGFILDAMGEGFPVISQAQMEGMSAYESGVYAEALFVSGRWQETESYFNAQLEKGESESDLEQHADAFSSLGRLCCKRGDMAQARLDFQKAKAYFEAVGNFQGAEAAMQALLRL